MVPPASDRVPRVRPYSGVICVSSASPTGILPSVSELSSPLRLTYLNRVMMILNPEASFGLASFPFARRYSENRCFFLFLRLLRCFSSPGSPPYVMDWRMDDTSSSYRVSPFRHLRIKDYLHLPAAFRSLSRLSSALSAKASTLRSSLLNLFDA